MSTDLPIGETMADRYARLLAGFAERTARVAADLEDRYQSTEDHELAVKLAGALAVTGRALRQTIALAMRLERDAVQAARAEGQAEDQARAARAKAVAERKSTARAGLLRLLWTEYEHEEFDFDAGAVIRDLVEEISKEPGFADGGPLEPFLHALEARFHGIMEKRLAESERLAAGEAEEADASSSPHEPATALADSS